MQAPKDTLELLKYGLKDLTLGYVDLTEATNATRDSQAALDSQMASGRALVDSMLTERIDLMKGLNEQVMALTDHSAKAEEKFSQDFVYRLRLSGDAIDFAKGDVAGAFRRARIEDVIKGLEKEAETYGKSKAELIEYKLATEDASLADHERANALLVKMKAVDDAKAADKEAAKESAKAEQESIRLMREAERERQKLVDEGKKVHDSLRNPFEKLRDETLRAKELFDEGVISVDDFERALVKLAEGPKEITKTLKFQTLSESLGVKAPEFNSAADFAMRDAYRENVRLAKLEYDRSPEVRESERIRRSERLAGYLPGTFKTPDQTTTEQRQKTEEAKNTVLFNQMLTQLQLLVQNTSNKKFVTLSPAKLGT
jgi:hypothetical protein